MNCFPEFCEPNQQINKPKEGITYTYLISTFGHILRFLDSILKSRDITLPPKIWCFQIVVLEKTLENPLESKMIKPVNPKWTQSWIFIGMTDFDPKAPTFGHLMWRDDSLEKTLMLGMIACRRRGERGGDGWMESLTQWTWIWANSRR